MEVRHFESFSDVVKDIRHRNRMSQRALARELNVSAGYVGQWELGLSQPSGGVLNKLCERFDIQDLEYLQRLVYAQRAPDWLKESIVRYQPSPEAQLTLSPTERRILVACRRLEPDQLDRLADRVEVWTEALSEV